MRAMANFAAWPTICSDILQAAFTMPASKAMARTFAGVCGRPTPPWPAAAFHTEKVREEIAFHIINKGAAV
jgi:alpha-D-ribose 1-methylphosphonate 5-triphosphate synthase subunit PhnH